MPRGRGGSRQGSSGKSYTNRSDLNAAKPAMKVVPGQTYGVGAAQLEAQRAVPMAPPPQSPSGAGVPGSAPAPGVLPGGLGSLLRPTEMPDQPLTAGIAGGMGPGPEAVGMQTSLSAQLRQIYRYEPNEDLRELIEEAERMEMF